jgi:hypothetical protein
MGLPAPPDLARPRWRLVATAAAVTLIMGLVLGFQQAHELSGALGDTDDAMRLVLVRELLNGQGWWDQHLMRLQPPLGVYMHWSRLLDGGIALMERGFALFAPTRAEWLTRLVWPLLWIFPAAAAVLSLSDRLSERGPGESAPGAVLACAFYLITNMVLYLQFHPGRVDHHDVQMTCCFLALAGAARRGPSVKGAVLAGVASGLGLAIGLEALVFEAAIGAAIALRFVFDVRDARPLRAYGLTLAGTTLLAFLIQTPPWRWSVTACDALAANSAAAIVVAGLAVTAAVALTVRRSARARFLALAAAAALSAGAYVMTDPHCLRGPFADVDPAIKGFWLVHVKEMRPWPLLLKLEFDNAVALAAAPLMAVLGLIWLGRRRQTRQDSAFRMTVGVFALTIAAGVSGVRMWGYADWIAMAVIAAAAADLAAAVTRRFGREPLAAFLIAALLADPIAAAGAVQGVHKLSTPPKKTAPVGRAKTGQGGGDHCLQIWPYRPLAALKPNGLVLSEIDLGPFVLAESGDSVLAAPYHRMSWGMVAARGALAADADGGGPGGAEAKTRALGVTYVLECRAHWNHTDRVGMAPRSLQKRLDGGEPPAWLVRVSAPGAPLDIYRLRPAGPPQVARTPGGGGTASAPAPR